MKIAYVSGPITGDGPGRIVDNCLVASFIATKLRELGYAVICPHEAALIYSNHNLTHNEWMKIDLKLLSICDLCVLLTNDKERLKSSKGTMEELEFCKNNNIPVYAYTENKIASGLERIHID